MADNDEQKTEQKSHKKWEEARDQGELPRSQEIATFAVLTVMILYFSMMRGRSLEALGSITADFLRFDRHLALNAESLDDFLLSPFLKTVALLAPLFGVIILVSTVVNMGQTGFNIAKDRLQFNWGHLDPIKGAGKLVSVRAWIEGGKSILKISVFLYLAYYTLKGATQAIIELPVRELRDQIDLLIDLSIKVGTRIVILMAALSLGDYFYQWWHFQERLKMTPAELKEEMKEQEGDPLIRQRMRSLRMEMTRKRMMAEVKKADVIVTNPTHYAVAIRYDKDRLPAPFVCAKGTQYLAARIREIGSECGIPIIENPPIARALYKQVKVGHMVPSEFYRVIAELLAFVFLLKRRSGGRRIYSGLPLRPRLKAALPPGTPSAPAHPAA